MLAVSISWRYRLFVTNEVRKQSKKMLSVYNCFGVVVFVTNEPRKYSNQMLAVHKVWRYKLFVTNEPREQLSKCQLSIKNWRYWLVVTNESRKYSKQMLAVSKSWRDQLFVTNEPKKCYNQMLTIAAPFTQKPDFLLICKWKSGLGIIYPNLVSFSLNFPVNLQAELDQLFKTQKLRTKSKEYTF